MPRRGRSAHYAHRIADAPDETLLLAAARDGDREALNRLLRAHYDRVHALCRRIAGNDADADDATQEALLTIVRRLDRYDGRSAFSTWVYRVATNACLDELRRRKRRPMPRDLSDLDRRDRGHESAVAARIDVDRALAELSHDYRAAVVLRDLCGLEYADIADILDIPPGTVRSRISRGRAAVANHLTGNSLADDHRPMP